MLEWLRRVAGEKKRRAQRLVPVVFWALALAPLLQPIAASGADPAVSSEAEESAGAPAPKAPAPDPKWTDAEAAQDEEAALKDELLEQERPEPEDRPVPAIDPEGWSYKWNNGSDLVRNDGRYELLFGGQVQYEGAAFHLDEGLKRTEGDGWDSDSDFRRLRAYVQGFAFDHLMFRVAYDFEDQEVKDVYAGLLGLGPLGAVQGGYMKEPFSLEQAMSLQNLTFLERSLANALVPRRNTGVLATSTHFERRLRWAAGVFFLDESLAEADESLEGVENDWEVAARVNWVPVSSEDGSRLVMAGCSYSHIFSDAGGLTIGTRPESRLVPALIQTPEILGIDGGDRLGVEVAWLEGSLSVQAEAIGVNIQRDQGFSDLLFWGGYAQVAYFLTGERRIYGRAAGAFGRVIPQNPFRPSKRQWGAFQLAARVSTLDLNDSDIRGGQELNFTLGLNWYLLANLRLSANYVHGRVFGQGDVDILQARLQVDF
jgi:phosphate-selective porin OprO/OprP